MEYLNPVYVILSAGGTQDRVDRLLFMYPFASQNEYDIEQDKRRTAQLSMNPYSLIVDEDTIWCQHNLDAPSSSKSTTDSLSGLLDKSGKVLAPMFQVKPDFFNRKFELKVNNARFVGHPMPIESKCCGGLSLTQFHVVFALKAGAKRSVVRAYYDLSKRIAVALRYEDNRVQFLHEQVKKMLDCHEDLDNLPECMQEICDTGTVRLYINRYLEVSFFLPHKIHVALGQDYIEPSKIEECCANLRAYHGVLMLEEPTKLRHSLPLDASPDLIRLIKVASPLKNLAVLAADADLTRFQIFKLVAHLVYWGKAIIIYPLAETNEYVISPNAQFAQAYPHPDQDQLTSPKLFSKVFKNGKHDLYQKERLLMASWLLKHRLIVQVHTYVYLIVNNWDNDVFECSPEAPLSISKALPDLVQSGSDISVQSLEYLSTGTPAEEEPRSEAEVKELLGRRLTPGELTEVLKISSNFDRSEEVLKDFSKLCPYFRGQHHVEEIMYNENMTRATVLSIIDRFRDILVLVTHEDSISAIFNK